MRKKIVVLLLVVTLFLTGCTSYVKDKKGAAVKEPTTGQTLASNILCKPTNKNVIKTYKKYNVNIDKLPDCSKFTPASGKSLSKYSITFGQKADLSDGYEVVGSTTPSIDLYNTFLGVNYFKINAKFMSIFCIYLSYVINICTP